MEPKPLHCPHCSIVLRIRDRKHVGREVDCPDCGRPILVLADGPRRLQLVEPNITTAAATPERQTATSAVLERAVAEKSSAKLNGLQQWTATLTTATGIAWIVAGVCSLALLSLAWPFGMDGSHPKPVDKPNHPAAADGVAPPNNAVGPQQQSANNIASAETRLEQLGRSINEFVGEHQRFPASMSSAEKLTESQRLSWLAELVASEIAAAGPQPLWDQAWRDPLNDRFVRRTLSEFHNPNIKQLTGPDRYPATHFVGIAGVGADGPMLPVNHRRAGIFGVGRRTRTADVKDGLSNTMLVVGVTQNIGSWAGSGRATMRPLTREPYINGPDGFGTGEGQGMSVLMADGSVRFLAKGTDPRLLRRLAAMADGLTLDLKIPGNPGDLPPGTQPKPPGNRVAPNNPNQPPAEPNVALTQPPVIAPEPPRIIDVAALLTQPILEYEQKQATPFRIVLAEVEEMLGVPIRFEEKQLKAALEKEVTIKKIENTTAGEILRELLEQAGLAFVIEKNAIRIKPQ